jgi:multidrug resistance efflux pump
MTDRAPLRIPKLRGDLDVSSQETPAGEVVHVVKDPATGRFYRFGAAEWFIMRLLDGRNSPEAICRAAGDAFGEELDRETLGAFVSSLERRGLLESPAAAGGTSPRPHARRGRVFGSLLYLRLKAFDPDRLLDRLLPPLRFCFTPAFVAASAGLIGLAVLTLVANSQELGRDITRIFSVQGLLTAWLVVLVSTILHEFAHGLTCKRFGGKVHEMGFLLLYFQPALYCNVSDAWLFPEKSRRLWVTFAGAYFELFLWGLAVIVWRVSAPETVFNYLALVLIATSGIRIFFNLNPLIKLDGYYMLSDWLEIPNLRARATGYVKARLAALWRWEPSRAAAATRRERRIFIGYGLLALVFSIWLLSFIGARIGGFLIENYEGAGFLVFSGLLTLLLWRPIRRRFARVPANGLARGTSGSVTRRAAYLLGFGGLAAALIFLRADLTVSGEFTILPRHNADVRAQVPGLIGEIFVSEGDLVERGQLIARLSDLDSLAELEKTEAEIRQKQADLRSLEAGPVAEEVAVARHQVETAETKLEHARIRFEESRHMRDERRALVQIGIEKAQEQLRYARNELKRMEPLAKKQIISQVQFAAVEEAVMLRAKELEEAQSDLKLALADDMGEMRQDLAGAERAVVEAQADLAVMEAGNRPELIEAARAEIARLEAQGDHLERQLALLEVTSPIGGIVTTPKPSEKIGELVERGDLILEVHDYRTAVGEIHISEKDIGTVRLGQEVSLKARAYPDRSFTGKVTAIASTAMDEEEGLRRKVMRVSTEIENADLALKPQMTGFGKVNCGERRLVEIVTRRLVRFIRVEFWSWW